MPMFLKLHLCMLFDRCHRIICMEKGCLSLWVKNRLAGSLPAFRSKQQAERSLSHCFRTICYSVKRLTCRKTSTVATSSLFEIHLFLWQGNPCGSQRRIRYTCLWKRLAITPPASCNGRYGTSLMFHQHQWIQKSGSGWALCTPDYVATEWQGVLPPAVKLLARVATGFSWFTNAGKQAGNTQ